MNDLSNARLPNETFEEYKRRIRFNQIMTKQMHKGRLVWNSSRAGTYVKKEHANVPTN